jgi:hypothetical protein
VNHKGSNKIISLISFLALPIGSLISSFYKRNSETGKLVLWLFVSFYGLVFVVKESTTDDSRRYADKLVAEYNSIDNHTGTKELLDINKQEPDLYQPIITFLISRFTDNYRVLFVSFAICLGFVFSRNIWWIIEQNKSNFDLKTILLLFTYAYIVNIGIALNGVRMWTAAHFFLFGVLKYFLKQNKQIGVILICLTPLVHFAYLLPVLVFIIYLIVTLIIDYRGFYLFYLASFFLEELDFELGRTLVLFLPKAYSERSEGFVSVEKETQFLENVTEKPWFIEFGNLGMKYGIFIFVTIIVLKALKKRYLIKNVNWMSFSMFLLGVSSLLTSLPSGSRYQIIAQLIVFPYLILEHFEHRNDKILQTIIWILIPGFLLYSAFSFRMMLEYVNYYLLVGNPFIAALFHVETSIYELIESIF